MDEAGGPSSQGPPAESPTLLLVTSTESAAVPTAHSLMSPAGRLISGLILAASAVFGVQPARAASAPVKIVSAPANARVGEAIDVRAIVPRRSACELRIGRGGRVAGRTRASVITGTTYTSRIFAPSGDGTRTLTVACGASNSALRAGIVRTSRRGIVLRPVVALATVRHGIVDIDTKTADGKRFASGTGMILTPTGEVLTNDHVIRDASSITVTDVSTGATYPANVVGYDTNNDVAVLQIQGAPALSQVTLGDSSKVTVGAPVSAVGNANGVGGTPTTASGRVTKLHQAITVREDDGGSHRLRDLIQIDANLQSGESGGPLFDETGQVIGMNTAGSSTNGTAPSSEGFAIPINAALAIVKQIESGVETATVHIGSTGFLGISVPRTATNGAVLTRVTPGSPAAVAGLVPGDRITSFDGAPTPTRDDLVTQIKRHHAGDVVAITWVDATGAARTATATLTEGPPG